MASYSEQETPAAVTLRESDHTYWIGGHRLRGANEIVRSVTPVFQADMVAGRIGMRDGKPKAEVLAAWAKERDDACARGKLLHAAIEQILSPGPDPEGAGADLPQFKAWLDWWVAEADKITPIATEISIHHDELGIAGTPDLVALAAFDGRRAVYDWKQNKRFEFRSRYGERMLPPFDDLDSCEHVHYSMQASLYRLCLERMAKNEDEVVWQTGDAFVVWMPPGGEAAKCIKLLDLRARLAGWLRGQGAVK